MSESVQKHCRRRRAALEERGQKIKQHIEAANAAYQKTLEDLQAAPSSSVEGPEEDIEVLVQKERETQDEVYCALLVSLSLSLLGSRSLVELSLVTALHLRQRLLQLPLLQTLARRSVTELRQVVVLL